MPFRPVGRTHPWIACKNRTEVEPALDKLLEVMGDNQSDLFLLETSRTRGTHILTPVSGVDDDGVNYPRFATVGHPRCHPPPGFREPGFPLRRTLLPPADLAVLLSAIRSIRLVCGFLFVFNLS